MRADFDCKVNMLASKYPLQVALLKAHEGTGCRRTAAIVIGGRNDVFGQTHGFAQRSPASRPKQSASGRF
jgi:hypothetical protein